MLSLERAKNIKILIKPFPRINPVRKVLYACLPLFSKIRFLLVRIPNFSLNLLRDTVGLFLVIARKLMRVGAKLFECSRRLKNKFLRLPIFLHHFLYAGVRRAFLYYYSHRKIDVKRVSPIKFLIIISSHALIFISDIVHRYYFRKLDRILSKYKLSDKSTQYDGALLVAGTLGPGGAERQVVTTLIGLKKANISGLSLLCRFLKSETERFYLHHLEAEGIYARDIEEKLRGNEKGHDDTIIRALQKSKFIFFGNFLKFMYLDEVFDYMRAMAPLKPKVAHLWLDEVNIKAGIAAVAAGFPKVILSQRSLPPYNFLGIMPYYREGYRWLARQPNVVLTNNSAAGARAYEKWLKLPAGSIKVIRNGFNYDQIASYAPEQDRVNYRKKYNIPDSAVVLGSIMRLSEEKRPMLWLEAASRVRKKLPDTHFLIVGHGNLYEQIKVRAEQDDLRGSIHLVGYEKEPLLALAAMDLFLLTSRVEGIPNVLLEAQAIGVPVITTDAGGARETINNKQSGWVLENDNPDHIANIIEKCIKDQEWLREARQNGPHFVKKEFGVDRMIKETISLYNSDEGVLFKKIDKVI